MPLTFPSHQGLVAPLWRRWPETFNALALCVGAAMPDIVDGALALYHGSLGQRHGHSLVGLVALCLPLGLLLRWLLARCWIRLNPGPEDAKRFWRITLSVSVGSFSHLAFDFISHGDSKWLYPWYETARIFPAWWYSEWFRIPLPLYDTPYSVGPHLVAWLGLSALGIVMFFRGESSG